MSLQRHRFTYRRRHRLRLDRDFRRVLRRRRSSADHIMTVYVAGNDLPHCRFGLRISRRVGRAWQRNRIKRRLREAFRLNQHVLPAGLDIVCLLKAVSLVNTSDYAASLCRLVAAAARKPEVGNANH